MVGRKNLQVRWFRDNLACLCPLCHRWGTKSAHQDPIWFTEWYRNFIGNERYEKLRDKSNSTAKIYDVDLIILYELLCSQNEEADEVNLSEGQVCV